MNDKDRSRIEVLVEAGQVLGECTPSELERLRVIAEEEPNTAWRLSVLRNGLCWIVPE